MVTRSRSHPAPRDGRSPFPCSSSGSPLACFHAALVDPSSGALVAAHPSASPVCNCTIVTCSPPKRTRLPADVCADYRARCQMDSQRRGARTILHQSEAADRHEPGRVRRPGAGTIDASEWWIAAHSRLARKSLSTAPRRLRTLSAPLPPSAPRSRSLRPPLTRV